MAQYSIGEYLKGILIYFFRFGSICVFSYDVFSDYYLGYIYASNGDTWYAALTFAFAFFPSFINSLWTAYTFYTRNYDEDRLLAYPVVVYPLCFFLQGQLAGALIWLSHAATDYPLYQSAYMQEIKYSCIGITVYIEVVLESLPQLCLQLYIVINQGSWTTVQLISITGSIMGAGLGLSTLMRRFSSQLLACIVNTMWLLFRAVSIGMVGSVKKYLGVTVLAAHYLFVCCLCFCDQERMDFVEKIMASTISFHNIYTPLLHPRITTLSIVTAIEIISCSVCGYLFGEITLAPGKASQSASNLTINSRNHSLFVPAFNSSWLNVTDAPVLRNQSFVASSPLTIPLQDWEYANALLGLTIPISIVAMLLSIGGRYKEQQESHHFKGWGSYSLDQPTE